MRIKEITPQTVFTHKDAVGKVFRMNPTGTLWTFVYRDGNPSIWGVCLETGRLSDSSYHTDSLVPDNLVYLPYATLVTDYRD